MWPNIAAGTAQATTGDRILKSIGYLAVLAAFLPVPAIAQDTAPSPGAERANATIAANLSPDAQRAVTGVNAFSVDLYKRTLVPDQNLFIFARQCLHRHGASLSRCCRHHCEGIEHRHAL